MKFKAILVAYIIGFTTITNAETNQYMKGEELEKYLFPKNSNIYGENISPIVLELDNSLSPSIKDIRTQLNFVEIELLYSELELANAHKYFFENKVSKSDLTDKKYLCNSIEMEQQQKEFYKANKNIIDRIVSTREKEGKDYKNLEYINRMQNIDESIARSLKKLDGTNCTDIRFR